MLHLALKDPSVLVCARKMSRISKRTDRRDLPRYTAQEVAHHLSIPASTVRAWSVGQHYRARDGEAKRFQPLVKAAVKSPLSLSFWNLAELYVLASLRRKHEVPMPNVRAALRYAARKLGSKRPLIDESFRTNGIDLFIEKYSSLINASQDGQAVIREVLEHSLERVERGTDGRVVRLYPWLNHPGEPHDFEVDPERSFGRLVLAGTGIPTEAIGERFRAGETIDEIAKDFGLKRARIEQALRWEQCAQRAA